MNPTDRPWGAGPLPRTAFRLRSIDCHTGGEPLRVVVEGETHVTGRHEFLIHPDDSLVKGFLLR